MAYIQSKACPAEGHDPGKPARITVAVTEAQLKAFNMGQLLIQEVFPHMSSSDRERFMTGYCSDCWDKMFPAEEEDDEPDTIAEARYER